MQSIQSCGIVSQRRWSTSSTRFFQTETCQLYPGTQVLRVCISVMKQMLKGLPACLLVTDRNIICTPLLPALEYRMRGYVRVAGGHLKQGLTVIPRHQHTTSLLGVRWSVVFQHHLC